MRILTTKRLMILIFQLKEGVWLLLSGIVELEKVLLLTCYQDFTTLRKVNIFIDNQNTKSVNLNSLRKNISLVSQDVILFDNSIKENILYANPKATDEELKESCQFAAAEEFIIKLPQKYDTNIGENGVRLSGGQKQRLSIARAILKNPL